MPACIGGSTRRLVTKVRPSKANATSSSRMRSSRWWPAWRTPKAKWMKTSEKTQAPSDVMLPAQGYGGVVNGRCTFIGLLSVVVSAHVSVPMFVPVRYVVPMLSCIMFPNQCLYLFPRTPSLSIEVEARLDCSNWLNIMKRRIIQSNTTPSRSGCAFDHAIGDLHLRW